MSELSKKKKKKKKTKEMEAVKEDDEPTA